jgi:ribosome-associated protein
LSTARTNKAVTTATLRQSVVDALDELKAKDVREIDVRGKTSIADEVQKFAKKAGVYPLGVEGEGEGEWVLVDLGDVIVHVMLPRIREFYGLERLWTVGDRDEDESEAAQAG